MLEGIDGSGKTTQAARLVNALKARGHLVESLREPGGTPLGENLRALLLDPDVDIVPEAELCLFAAARAQLVARQVRPALESGAIVVLDRFVDATLAYQGGGRGLPWEVIEVLQNFATGGIVPDLVIFLDLSPEEALHRRTNRLVDPDRVEIDGQFLNRVCETYRRRMEGRAKTAIIDASRSEDEVAVEVMDALARCRIFQ